jgi:Tfp pilus assembly protein FimT
MAREGGYTLAELVVSMAIMATVMGICIAWVPPMTEILQADADLQVLKGQVTLARERAANQRRSVEVQFIAPNIVQIVRQDLPNGTTTLSRVVLEHSAVFMKFNGQPDTPDGFGGTDAVNLGGAARAFFGADGTLTDLDGNPINATIFIGQPTRSRTSRALTIFGLTARVRGYRWNGATWRQ